MRVKIAVLGIPTWHSRIPTPGRGNYRILSENTILMSVVKRYESMILPERVYESVIHKPRILLILKS